MASGYAAIVTGEVDEERVETVVAATYIDAHEDAAEAFTWAGAVVLALFSLPALISKERLALSAAVLAVVGSVVVLGFGYRVGQSGGSRVYDHGAANAFVPPGAFRPSLRRGAESTERAMTCWS